MTENKRVVKDHNLGTDGNWYWSVPILSYQTYRDSEGNVIKDHYSTKSELNAEKSAWQSAVQTEREQRTASDKLKLDIPVFCSEGQESGKECYVAVGVSAEPPIATLDFVPRFKVGNLEVTGDITYDGGDIKTKFVQLGTSAPQTMTGSLIVGGHDLTKAVITDEEQTIDGSKTFGKTIHISRRHGDTAISIERTDYSVGEVVNNIQLGDISWKDKTSTTYTFVDSYFNRNGSIAGESTPYMRARLMAKQPNGGTARGLEVYNGDNGVCVANIPAVPSGASSNTVVNVGYVSATDGTTNNLVHNIGDETVNGTKDFTSLIKGGFDHFINGPSSRWKRLYTRTNTSLVQMFIFVGGQTIGFVLVGDVITTRIMSSSSRAYPQPIFKLCTGANGEVSVHMKGMYSEATHLYLISNFRYGSNFAKNYGIRIDNIEEDEPVLGDEYTVIRNSQDFEVVR